MEKISKSDLIDLLRKPNVKRAGIAKYHENAFTIFNTDKTIYELKLMKCKNYLYQEYDDGLVLINKYSYRKSFELFLDSVQRFAGIPEVFRV